ncbi:MAG TPA: transcription termination factor NusA [Anaerolineaceae bacterium]|nr:transcription termination factor NusA [Anaerolineaceae bacterium]
MKNEFTLAFNEVLEEKQLPKEVILKALESAMVSAYRRAVNASNAQHVEAKIDPETGHVDIYAEKEVVETVQDSRTEVSLPDAKKVDGDAEVGTMVVVKSTPQDFGRVAAQTARQVIQQRIREAERQAQMAYFDKQLGEISSGVVQAVNAQGVTVGLDMKAEGVMMRKEMIPGERFRVHDRVRALVFEVKDGPRGPQIMLSRAHRNFLRRLLENEVPEIYHGVVEIRSIAREPGERAKVAVAATQQGIDPVGACVGIRGVRIQAIVRELHDEKIDVIEWNSDPAVYIAKAISPARVSGVYLNERASGGKTATVVVPEDQLSLAIGRDGQNARLAAKLTGWRIDIKSLPEAASDTLNRVRTEPALSSFLETDATIIENVEAALGKKAEGRPLTPEEFETLSRFVDRVEKRSAIRRQAEKKTEEGRRQEVRASLPPKAFEVSLNDTDLSEHVIHILTEAGYETLGDLMVQITLDADSVLALQGMGPKAMQDIQRLVDEFKAANPPEVVEPVAGPAPEELVVEQAEEFKPGETAEVAQPLEIEIEVEAPEAAQVEAEPVAEVEAVAPEAEPIAELEEELPSSLDELFAMKPEVLEVTGEVEEEETEEGKSGKKGKKKKKHVEVTYDPDRDVMMVRKKHKRGGGEWDDWE